MLQLLGNVVKRSTTLPPKQLQQHQEYGKKWDVEVLWRKRKALAAVVHSEALSHSQGHDAKVLEDRGGSNPSPIPAREGGGRTPTQSKWSFIKGTLPSEGPLVGNQSNRERGGEAPPAHVAMIGKEGGSTSPLPWLAKSGGRHQGVVGLHEDARLSRLWPSWPVSPCLDHPSSSQPPNKNLEYHGAMGGA